MSAARFDSPHPESCGCHWCSPRPLRVLDPMPQNAIPLDPWWCEPRQIARLYRWLKLMDREPVDVALFIENADTWGEDYALMCAASGPA